MVTPVKKAEDSYHKCPTAGSQAVGHSCSKQWVWWCGQAWRRSPAACQYLQGVHWEVWAKIFTAAREVMMRHNSWSELKWGVWALHMEKLQLWRPSGNEIASSERLCCLSLWRASRPDWTEPWTTASVLRADPSLSRRLETSVSLFQPELPSKPVTLWNVLCEKEDPKGFTTGLYTVQVHSLSCFCGLCSSLLVQQEEGVVITIFSKYWWPQDKCHPGAHSAEKTGQTYAPELFPNSKTVDLSRCKILETTETFRKLVNGLCCCSGSDCALSCLYKPILLFVQLLWIWSLEDQLSVESHSQDNMPRLFYQLVLMPILSQWREKHLLSAGTWTSVHRAIWTNLLLI